MSINNELSDLFATFSALLEIKGEPVFKAIAFQKISRLLRDNAFDAKAAVESGTLDQVEGVGASNRRIIEQFVKTGRSMDFDEVAASVPAGLLPLLQIPGLGPKTIALLWKKKNVLNIEDLVKAIESGSLLDIKGMGEKKIASIKQGIALRAQAGNRIGIVDALPIGQAMVERLREVPGVLRAELAGSLRRRRETIGDLDLVCTLDAKTPGASVSKAFVEFPEVQRILGQGDTKASVISAGGVQVDLRIIPPLHFGAAMQYFTGSKDHNKKLRSLALDKGMTLNEWGLYRQSDYDKSEKKTGQPPAAKPVASLSERDVYAALGLPEIEPVLREDRGEIEAAIAGTLPPLIELADIRADLHTHTTASDGKDSIAAMAEAAIARGYKVLAITDHSKSQVIANGLTADRLIKHIAEIHKVGQRYKEITLLAGCEVDILVDGRLDFEDEVLAQLDWVVASPHISLKQDTEKATSRILRAIDNPYVNVIGHPTGRLIHQREGLPLDFARVFKAAAETKTALEINAGYPRLDLNDINAHGALAAGVTLSINTDAHSIGGLDEMVFGVDVARRAWATSKQVLNCWTAAKILAFVKNKRPK